MTRLENDPFLNELTKIIKRSQQAGSMYITMKKISLAPQANKKVKKGTTVSSSEKSEECCLIRVKGSKRKISTILRGKDVIRFQMAYATIIKAHFDGLKKREKKKAKHKKKIANKEQS